MQDTVNTGEDRAGTRNKFGNHVFPTSIDPGQDVLKFNMMKYVPKKFDQKTFGFDIKLIKRLNNAGAINQEHADVLINNYHYRQKEIIRKKTINEN